MTRQDLIGKLKLAGLVYFTVFFGWGTLTMALAMPIVYGPWKGLVELFSFWFSGVIGPYSTVILVIYTAVQLLKYKFKQKKDPLGIL